MNIKRILLFICLSVLCQFLLAQNHYFDSSFGMFSGGDNFFKEDIGGVDYIKESVLGQDGNIYFTGWSSSPLDFTIGSITSNGSINPNFGSNYLKKIDIPDFSSNGYSVKQSNTGSLYVGGVCIGLGNNYSSIFVSKLNMSGELDTAYADSGIFIYSPTGGDYFVGEVLVNANDEVYILGRERFNNGNFKYFLMKINSLGIIDSSFNNNGILSLNSSSSNRYLTCGLIRDNGQILIAGTDMNNQFYLINPDGTLQNGFGNVGNGIISSSENVEFYTVKEIRNNSYMAVGKHRSTLFTVVCKFDSTGVDSTFGNNGFLTTSNKGFMEDAIINESLDIYLTGNFSGEHYVVKLDSNAGFDSSFYTGGISEYKGSFNNVALYTLTQGLNDEIYAGGLGIDLVNSNSGQDFFMLKLSKSATTSIYENDNSKRFFVYPNPSNGEFIIQMSANVEIEKFNFAVYNLIGEKVIQKEGQILPQIVDLSHLNGGQYIIHIFNDEISETQIIVKQ